MKKSLISSYTMIPYSIVSTIIPMIKNGLGGLN